MSTIFKNRISFGFEWTNIEKILWFLISSSLFVATVGFSAIYISFSLFEISPRPKLFFASILVTLTIYNLNKLTDKEEDAFNVPERADFIKNREKHVIFFSTLSYGIGLVLGLLVDVLAVFILLFPLVSGIVYSVKIFSGIRLKDIFAIKNVIVALSWAVVAAFLPIICSQQTLTLTLFIFYFLFIKTFVNTVIFDVRDVEGDRRIGTKSIPVVIGIHKTRYLLLAIQSTLIIWLGISLYHGLFIRYLPVLILNLIYEYYYIFYFCNEKTKDKKELSFDLILDGGWIILAVFVFIHNIFCVHIS